MRTYIPAAIALIALFPVIGTAAVYKWVDASGKVHYSQAPPAQGRFQEMPKAPPPGTSPNQDALKKYLDQSSQARGEAQVQRTQQATAEQQRKAQCDVAREQLRVIEGTNPHRLAYTRPDGSIERWGNDAYVAEKAKAQAAVAKSC